MFDTRPQPNIDLLSQTLFATTLTQMRAPATDLVLNSKSGTFSNNDISCPQVCCTCLNLHVPQCFHSSPPWGQCSLISDTIRTWFSHVSHYNCWLHKRFKLLPCVSVLLPSLSTGSDLQSALSQLSLSDFLSTPTSVLSLSAQSSLPNFISIAWLGLTSEALAFMFNHVKLRK